MTSWLVGIAVVGGLVWVIVAVLLVVLAARRVFIPAGLIAAGQRVERQARRVMLGVYLADLVVIVVGIFTQHRHSAELIKMSAVPLFLAFFVRVVSGVLGRAGQVLPRPD